ncbi:MAG: hypothetical protein IPG47_11465 [Thermoflexaceae bacterium]|nr:hypothetical protein [Thermoflexaceae bacterium]
MSWTSWVPSPARAVSMARASGRPGLARVERGDDAEERLTGAGGAIGAAGGDGCGLDAREQVIDRTQGVAPAGEAAEGIAAVLRERLQRAFEAGRLGKRAVVAGEGEVDGAIEHHRADGAWEQAGVDLPDLGAVAEAEVRELLVAEGGAEAVEVPGDVAGAEVGEDIAVGGGAFVGEGPREPREGVELGFVVGAGVGCGKRDEGGMAGYGTAAADASRVETDDVEAVQDAVGQVGCPLAHELDAARARAAGVDDEGADALRAVAGGEADDGELDLAGGDAGVVEGEGEEGAFEAIAAVIPGHGRGVRGVPLHGGKASEDGDQGEDEGAVHGVSIPHRGATWR